MKYLKLSLLAMLLIGISTSCLKMEEEDIFDDNAAARLDKAIKSYNEILTAEGGKWMLEYYSNSGEPGYVYLMTFNKNGSVKISGKNTLIGELQGLEQTSAFGSEVSMWDVIGDNGPVLTFNTYNSIFHVFANPEDIGATDTDEQGYGHEGDYEFDLMKYQNDTLYIDGKKYELHMLMTRVSPDVDDATFFDELDAKKAEIFSASIPELYLTDGNGKRFVCTDASSMIWSIYPEGGDAITETEVYNAIFTPSGFRFMSPFKYDGGQVQSFKLQGDKFVGDDGKSFVAAAALGTLFTDSRFKWQVDASASSGALLEAYNAITTGTKAYNGSTLTYINFMTTTVNGEPVRTMMFRVKMKTGSKNLDCNLYNVVTTDGTNVSFKFTGEGDKNALVYQTNVAAIAAFVKTLEEGQYTLSTDRPLGPSVIKMVDKTNPDNYLTLKVV